MIFADSLLLAEASMRKYLGLEPLFPISEPWQWLLLILAAIGALAFIIAMYVFDGVELPTGVTVLLGALRVVALLGLIAFFLNPGIRSEKRIVKNSRVPVTFHYADGTSHSRTLLCDDWFFASQTGTWGTLRPGVVPIINDLDRADSSSKLQEDTLLKIQGCIDWTGMRYDGNGNVGGGYERRWRNCVE